MNSICRSLIHSTVALILWLAPRADAATFGWSGSGSGPGSGAGTPWLTIGNWTNNAGTPTNTDIAFFGAGGSATAIGFSLNGAPQNSTNLGAIVLGTGSTMDRTIGNSATVGSALSNVFLYGVGGGLLTNEVAGRTLTIAPFAQGGSTVPLALRLMNSGVIHAAGSINLIAHITEAGGSRGFTKTGPGTLTLSTNNSFSGKVIVMGGALAIADENRLGTNPGTATPDQLTLDGGVLQTTANVTLDDLNRGITLGAAHGTFSANGGTTLTVSRPIVGSGNLTNSGAGTLILNTANSYSGRTVLRAGIARAFSGSGFGALPGSYVADRIILDGGGILNQDAEFTLEANRGITLGAGGGRLQAGFSKQWGVNSIIAGSGNLTIAADATPHLLSLNGVNTFTGDFIVNNNTSGSWALAAVNGSLAPGGRALVTTNGWLMGSGVINRVVIATNGATLGAGGLDAAGTLTINSNVFLTNALLRMDLANSTAVGGGVNDLLQVNGNLTLSGAITVVPNALQGVLAAGTYRIIQYTGSLTGNEVNLIASVPGYSIVFDTSTAGEVNMVVTGTPASLVWKGVVSTNWDVGATANWAENGVAGVFQQGAAVLFDDTGFYGPSINLVGPNVGWNSIYPAAVTVDSSSNIVFTSVGSGGKLSGGMTFNKRGPGTLTLSTGNANFPNDFSGQTIVEGGVLNLGYARALGSTNGSTTVSNGATLDLKGFNPTLENFIVGGSGVNHTGAVINTGGALANNGLRGSVSLAGDATFGGINRWDVFNGRLFGNGFNLTKTGPPEIALSNLGETGLGDIDILQGQLTFLGNTTMGNPARTLTVSPGATLAYWSPGNNVLNKNLVLNSANVINNSGVVATNAGSVGINGAASFAHSSDIVLTGPIAGSGNITKSGAGQLILTGTNSLSGTNTILAGRLALAANGSLSNSPVIDVRSGANFDVSRVTGGTWNLAADQTLMGVGTVYGNVVAAGGSIVPGTSPGTLTIQSNLTLSGGTAVFELAAITNMGGGINDLIFVTNNLTFAGTSTLKIVPLAPLNTTQPYTLFVYSNLLTGGAAELNVVSDSRYSFTLDTSAPRFVRLTASGAAGNLVWAGGVIGSENLWDLNTTANWLDGVTPELFRSGDVVFFDDTSSYTNVIVAGSLSVGGINVDGTQTYQVEGGRIATAGLVTRNGTGRLIFAVDNPEMAGGVLINSGSVELGAGGTAGTVGSSPITNLASLVLNRADTNTVANVIRGAGAVFKTGAGQTTLSGANSFTGPLVVDGGTLRQGAAGAFGQAVALNVEAGGQIDLGGISPSVRSNSYYLAGSGPDGRGALLNTGAGVSGNSGISNVILTADATVGTFGSDGNGRFDFGAGATGPGQFGQLNANEFTLTKVGPGAVNQRIPSIHFPLLVVSNGLYYGENFDFNLATNIIVHSNAAIGMFAGGSFRSNSSALTLHQGATIVNVGGNMTNVWTGPVTNVGAATINVAGASGSGHIQFLNNLYGSAPYNVVGGNNRNVELHADNDETFTGAWNVAGSTILRAMTNGTFGPGALTNNGVVEWLNTNETTLAQAISGGGTFRHQRGAGQLILAGSISQGTIFLQNGDLSSNVTFASSALISANSLSIGTSNAAPNGNTVGSARLVIEPGAVLRAGNIFLGDQNTQTGQVTQAGGTVAVTNQFRLGHWPNNVSTYTIDEGAFSVLAAPPSNPSGTAEQNGALYVGVDGVGVFNQNGGTVSTPALVLDNRSSTVIGLNTNTYNLLGGTLSLGAWGMQSPVSSYQVNLGAGTLAASQSWTSSLRMTLTANLTVNPNGNVITLNGPLSGGGGIIKAGTGTLLLNATNSFSADLNVSEGTVGGNGVVSSYVYVDAAGVLAPGTSVGVFTVSNDVQLSGTALMEISRTGQALTSDRLRVMGNTLMLGGKLIVTNIGQPLIGGEVFDLFDWVAVSGAFDVLELPPLPSHLAWNTANFYVDGTLQVDGPPTITLSPVSQTVYRGDNVFFRGQATNINLIGVRWQKGGVDLPEATASTLALTNVQLSDAATYTFIASNAFGESSASATLTVLEVTNLNAGLIAYWPLDAVQDGFTPDATTNGNHLFLTNMTVTNLVAGQRSNALNFFTNASSLLTRTYTPANVLPAHQYQGYTVAMWVKGPTNQVDRRVFAESSTHNNNPLVNLGTFNSASTNGAVDVFIRTDAGGAALVDHRKSTLPAFDDTWHHLVWVDNNGSAQLYVDGLPDASNFNYARGTLTLNTVTLGAIQRSTASAWFQGAIDDVMIWRRALDSNEVVCVMTNSLAGPPAIVAEPASVAVQCSSEATFTVAAVSYDSIRYQWHFDGAALPNATNAVLAVPGTAANAGSYFVVLTNCAGASTSAVAVLSVTNTPAVVSPGGELATGTENNACGSMVLAGDSVYRWEIADAGSSAGSNWDLLNVNGALEIQATLLNPFVLNVVTLNGSSAGPAANFDPAADYAWSFASASGGIIGFDPAAFSLVTTGFNNALSAGGEFRIAQSSNDLQVLYIHTPVIGESPTNSVAECGTGSATFAVTVSGTGPLYYQWRHAGTNLPGATGATLTVSPTLSSSAGAYDVIVSNKFGLATSDVATLSLQDTTAPVLTCAPNQTVTCGETWDFVAPAVSDNCAGALTPVAFRTTTNFTCGSTFAATRVWQVTDSGANVAYCTQTVALVDFTPPVITSCPPNQSIQCLAELPAPNPSLVIAAASSSETCDTNTPLVVHLLDVTNGVSPVVITRTYRAYDSCSNAADCIQTFTVEDTTPPVAACRNLTLVLTNTVVGITPADVNGGSTDNCALNILSVVPDTFTAANLGSNEVVLTVSDNAGHTNTCLAVVTVIEPLGTNRYTIRPGDLATGNPQFSAPHGTGTNAFGYDWDSASPEAASGGPLGYGCSSFAATVTQTGLTPAERYRTFRVGLRSLFGRNVKVGEIAGIGYQTRKGTPDSAVDWQLTIYTTREDANPGNNGSFYRSRLQATPGLALHLNAPADQWNAWSTAAGNNQFLFKDNRAGFGTEDLAWNEITAGTVTRATGAWDWSQEEVMMIDITLDANSGGGDATSQLDAVLIRLSDGTAADLNLEGAPISIACPANIATNTAPGQCAALVSYALPTITNGCDQATINCLPASGSLFALGVTPVLCEVTDGVTTNTCVFTVTVLDTEAPALSVPPALVVECSTPLTTNLTGTAFATDHCDSDLTLTFSDQTAIVVSTNALNGWMPRASGSPRTATAEFVSGPATAPSGVGSGRLAVGTNGGGAAEFRHTGYSNTLLSAFTELEYSTYRSQDGQGGQMAYLLLNVDLNDDGLLDDQLFFEPAYQVPAFNPSLPDQGALQTGSWQRWNALVGGWWSLNGFAGLNPGAGVKPLATYLASHPAARIVNGTTGLGGLRLVAGFGAGAWDNFDGHVDAVTVGTNGLSTPYDFEPSSGGCFLPTVVRTWVATDVSGNKTTGSQFIRRSDTTAPSLACPSNIRVTNAVGMCMSPVSYAVEAVDACDSSPTTMCVPASGSLFAVGVTTVQCFASDACGNTNVCSFTVTVVDEEAPILACSSNIVVECVSPAGTAVTFASTAMDSCDTDVAVTCTPASDSVFPPGVTTVTCLALDSSGNSNRCSFSVTVRDTTPPFLPQPIFAVGTDDGFAGAEPAFPGSGLLAFLDGNDLKGFDECTEDRTLAHTFTNLPPVIDGAILRIKMRACAGSSANDVINLVFARPDGSLMTPKWRRRIGTSAADSIPGLLPLDWSAGMEREFVLDLSSLTNVDGSVTNLLPTLRSQRSLDLYVQDDSDVDYAVLEIRNSQCLDDIRVDRDAGQCGALVTFDIPYADNCDTNLSIVCVPPSGSFFPAGTNTTVTCTATDASGNSAVCAFTVTVDDPTPPQLSIERSGSNAILSWPVGSACQYVLEEAPTMPRRALPWSTVTASVVIADGRHTVTIPIGTANRFFRLRYP